MSSVGIGPIDVLIAPDSFKGSLTSVDVARALATGWCEGRPQDRIAYAPLADGGEGILEAIAESGGWEWREVPTLDAVMRPMVARWLLSKDGRTAVVAISEASGLSRFDTKGLRPIDASSYGTGLVVRAVLDAEPNEIILGLGGSATTDGGEGLLVGLGASVGSDGDVNLSGLDGRLSKVRLRVACDVTNPLLGEYGAATVFGPQKGAGPSGVMILEDRLTKWAEALERTTGRHERATPGAGAAGGAGLSLLCLQDRLGGFELTAGVGLVMDLTGFPGKLDACQLVITGEGRIDAQTAFGKTAHGVAKRARDRGVSCLAFGGSVNRAGAVALAGLGAVAIPVIEEPLTLEAAIRAGPNALRRAAERTASVWTMAARFRGH